MGSQFYSLIQAIIRKMKIFKCLIQAIIRKCWFKPGEISQFGKKSAKVYHCLYSSTEELQMAMWAYIFFRLGFNNDNLYSHPPSQISQSPISPSLIPPSWNPPSRLVMVSLMTKAKRMIIDNLFRWFQKSGTKSRGVLHFVPLRQFYAVLFVPLFCRNAVPEFIDPRFHENKPKTLVFT